MRVFLSGVFLIFSQLLLAQNNAEIKGVVADAANQPLDKATVSVVSEKDSMVVTYTLTDDKGRFDLVRIPAQKDLVLHITHVNSAPYRRQINLKPREILNLDTVFMGGIDLDEVVITQAAPIRLNGDTLEYKADYFKTRPNANVEELLQLLPGLQVNVDGTIYYQGKQVSSIRINNKDFFAHDLTMGTRNLDASLIDVVQVIRDKGESKREILDDSDLPIVINLKTKKDFVKADFGKFYGSGGTRDRYESGALVNTFRDTLQISFIGYANNISRQGFDYSELRQYGGMGRAETGPQGRMDYGGLQNKISAGINANYDIGKKLKTNLMYTFDQQNDYVDNNNVHSSFYDTITETSRNIDNSTYRNYQHLIRSLIRYIPDTTSRISFETNIDLGRNKNIQYGSQNRQREENTRIQEGETNASWFSPNTNFRYNFRAEKKFIRSKLHLSFTQHYNNRISENDQVQNTLNRYYLFNDSLVDQSVLRWRSNKTKTLSNTLNLQVPIRKGVNWDFYTRYNRELSRSLEDINNRLNADVYTNRNDIANNKDGRLSFLYFGSRLNASLFKQKLRVSAGLEWLDFGRSYHYYGKTADLTDHQAYWLPNASITYNNTTFSYSKTVRGPSFYEIVAVDSDLYPTSTRLASPYFANQEEQAFSLRYFKSFKKIKADFNASVGYNIMNNSIASRMVYNVNSSESVHESYQAGGVNRSNINAGISKQFVQNKKWNVRLQTNGYLFVNQNFSTINGEENKGSMFYGSLTNTLTASYKNKVTLIPTYILNINTTRNERQTANFRNITNAGHSIGTVFRLDDVKKFRLETSYTLKNQPRGLNNDRTNLHVVNASLYYPLMQQKAELKFTAFDILNQNQNIWMGSFGNTNYYAEYLTLRQYFMLGLVYKFMATPNK